MLTAALSASAQVHYTVEVLDGSGRVALRLPRKRNLILDQGLDGIGSDRSWVESFTAAVAGTGTTPTKRDSGAITFSRAGSTVTADAGFFEAADVGRLLKFDSGEEVRITAFTDAQTVTSSTAGTIAAAEGTVWYVNQTALAAETKRTQTYSTDPGECGSTFSAPSTWTHKRSFVFSAEAAPVTYREIGWSHSTAPGGNLFGRDLLAGVGVSLAAGQQLKVVVEVSVTYGPSASTAFAQVVTGWSQNGVHAVEALSTDTNGVASYVLANGTSSSLAVLDPAGTAGAGYVGTESTALRGPANAYYSVAGYVGKALTNGVYAAGSFQRTKSVSFSISEANISIRSVGLAGGSNNSAYRVLLNAAEPKASTHTLTLVFTLSWGRVLIN